jgi:hypothetical protein
LCCTVDYDGRLKMNELVRRLIKEKIPALKFPETGSIYSYNYLLEEKTYAPW